MPSYSFKWSTPDADDASIVVRNGAGTVVATGTTADVVAVTNEAFVTYTVDLPAGDTYTATATVLGRSRTTVGVLDTSSAALSATIAAQVAVSPRPYNPYTTNYLGPYDKQGVVIAPGAPGAWDDGMVEAACPVFDPESGRYCLVYTGYPNNGGGPSLGIAWASHPAGPYVKNPTPILSGSGTPGAPDQAGVTGAMVFRKADGTWTVYSIGVTAAGYEAGDKGLCRFSTPSLASPSFTRHGIAVAKGGTSWRQEAAWMGCITERAGTFHLFMNGTGADFKERIGHGTASSIDGPWTMDTNPVLDVTAGDWDRYIVGQPQVFRVGNKWVMEYFGYDDTVPSAADGVATTTDAQFPGGWVKHPANPILVPSETYDAKFAHKPFSFRTDEATYHFYTAVAADSTRQVALAVFPAASPLDLSSAIPVTATSDTDRIDALIEALADRGLSTGRLVRDSFDRAPAASLGSTETGQDWTLVSGAWAINSSGEAAPTGDALAVVNTGTAGGTVSAVLRGAVPGGGQAIGLTVRFSAATDQFKVQVVAGGGIALDKYQTGVGAANVANASPGFQVGDRITVKDTGAALIVKRNGVTVLTYTSSFNNTATKVGVLGYSAPGTLDDFLVT